MPPTVVNGLVMSRSVGLDFQCQYETEIDDISAERTVIGGHVSTGLNGNGALDFALTFYTDSNYDTEINEGNYRSCDIQSNCIKIRLFWLAKQSSTMLQCRLQSVDLNLLFLTVLSLTTMLENLTISMLVCIYTTIQYIPYIKVNVLINTLEQSKLVNLTLPSFDSVILLFNLHPAMLLKQMKSLLVLFSSVTTPILIRHVNLHRLVLVNEDQHPNGQKMQPYLKSKHNFHILNNFSDNKTMF